MSKVGTYIKSILIPLIVGAVIAFIIAPFMDYKSLMMPPFAPPAILFPIVWTILYTLMGISYGILKSNNWVDDEINKVYYLQLAINALWPIFFFVFKWRLLAFFWILVLDIAVLKMIFKFYEKNKLSGILQIPYIIWLLFATYLNFGVYLLNG